MGPAWDFTYGVLINHSNGTNVIHSLQFFVSLYLALTISNLNNINISNIYQDSQFWCYR